MGSKNTTELTFRHATAEDLPEIVRIYNSTIASRKATADTECVSVADREPWFRAHDAKKRPLWIAEKEGTTVGWASLQSFYGRPAYDATAEISIYLDERFRGRGYGHAVLGYCMENALRCGVRTLLAFIFAHNDASLRLFEQAGFEAWGSLPDIARLDGRERTLKIYGKRIG